MILLAILLVFLVAQLLLLSLFLADFVLVRLEHLQHARDCRPIMPLSGTSADSDRLGDISSTVDAPNEQAAIAPNACTTLCEISLSLFSISTVTIRPESLHVQAERP